MSDQQPGLSEQAVAQQQQEKFQFYLLSLVFTLLALSVQTAKFGQSAFADAVEIAGWVCLLVSGIAGLWRLEWNPVIRVQLAQKKDFEEEIFRLKKLLLEGQKELHILENSSRQPIPDRIKNRQDAIATLDPHIKRLDLYDGIKYHVHRFGFVLGVVLIVVARAYPAVIREFGTIAV